MRLLSFENDTELSLTTFFGDDIPKYAILSHRWEAEEVTMADLMGGKYKKMAGYGKIQFCGLQAKRDDLRYFWVDTCCIDKSSSAELAEAINSMFRWYQNANKCYVYLSDVSKPPLDIADKPDQISWESEFRTSQWFTRGWTLQELIAPTSVEFFAKERSFLGTRESLQQQISDISGVPAKALHGSPLSGFSVTERLTWAKSRTTTRKEDKAYSLLGIFGVNMTLIYGEGEESAMKRLMEEIDKSSKGRVIYRATSTK
jgi:hypothetical protein